MKVNDTVEIRCSTNPKWNGIQLIVHYLSKKSCKGIVTKAPPGMEDEFPIGNNVEITAKNGNSNPLPELVVVDSFKQFKIDDVVEVTDAGSFGGLRFRITSTRYATAEGLVVNPGLPNAPVGSIFEWTSFSCLRLVERSRNPNEFVSQETPDKIEPGQNQAYIDHIYERLIENATVTELHALADRLKTLSLDRETQTIHFDKQDGSA